MFALHIIMPLATDRFRWNIGPKESFSIPFRMTVLLLKRASASRPSGEWNDDDFDVLADGVGVGRIMRADRRTRGNTLAVDARLWHNEDRRATGPLGA